MSRRRSEAAAERGSRGGAPRAPRFGAAAALLLLVPSPARAAQRFLELYRKAERMSDPQDRADFFTQAIEAWEAADGKTLLAACRLERGKADAELDRFDKAVEDLTAAVELDPGAAQAYLERGKVYAERGKLRPALQDVGRYLSFKPGDREGLLVRADVYRATGRFDEARADFEAAETLGPGDPRVPFGIGRVLAQQGRCLEARKRYDQALEASGGRSPEILYYRGACWAEMDVLAKALDDFTASIQGFEDLLTHRERAVQAPFRVREARLKLGKAYYQRGKAHMRGGERGSALEDFEKACGSDYEPGCKSAKALKPPKPPPQEAAPATPAARPRPASPPKKAKYKSKGDGAGDRYYGH